MPGADFTIERAVALLPAAKMAGADFTIELVLPGGEIGRVGNSSATLGAAAADTAVISAEGSSRFSYTRSLLSDASLTDPAATVTVTPSTPEAANTGTVTITAPMADTVRTVRFPLLDVSLHPGHAHHVSSLDGPPSNCEALSVQMVCRIPRLGAISRTAR